MMRYSMTLDYLLYTIIFSNDIYLSLPIHAVSYDNREDSSRFQPIEAGSTG
jgi:hypothetical protein